MNETKDRGNIATQSATALPAGYWEVISRRLWLLVAVFAGVAALTFLLGARERPLYQSSATLLVSQDAATYDPGHIFSQPGGVLSRRPNLANHIELLKSYALAQRVYDALPAAMSEALARYVGADPAARLQRWVSARPVRDADMIRLSVLAPRPELARALAGAYLEAYRKMSLERSRADISAVKDFVSSQLAMVGARLDSSESALESYKQSSRITDLSEETRALVDRQTQVLTLYEQTRAEREGLEREYGFLTDLLDSTGQALGVRLDNTSSPVVADLRAELYRLEAGRTNLLIQGYADTSSRVRAMTERVEALRLRLGDAASDLLTAGGALDGVDRAHEVAARAAGLQADLARLGASEQTLGSVVAGYDARLRRLPVRERVLARLTRNVEVDRQVHSLLAQRYEESRIQEAGRLSSVGTVDAPRPGVKVRPSHRNNALLALLLGLAFAFGAVFAADYLDTLIRRPEDLERHGFPVVASVPRVTDEPEQRGPVAAHQPDAPATEAFRILRTNLQFAAAGAKLRTFIVTSAGAGEGKSTIAANLATVLAQSGKRTLLLDADLRKPRQHRIHGFHKKPGLTDVVMLGAPLDQTLHPAAVERLDVLAAGTTPPSPVDFLNSPAFAGFLERMTSQYDCVVVDTPPTLVSADAAVAASRVDGVVLVARMGHTDHRALTEAGKLLAQAGARVLGVVANELKAQRRYGYYRYKYRYYHYRYRPSPQSDAASG